VARLGSGPSPIFVGWGLGPPTFSFGGYIECLGASSHMIADGTKARARCRSAWRPSRSQWCRASEHLAPAYHAEAIGHGCSRLSSWSCKARASRRGRRAARNKPASCSDAFRPARARGDRAAGDGTAGVRRKSRKPTARIERGFYANQPALTLCPNGISHGMGQPQSIFLRCPWVGWKRKCRSNQIGNVS
jgi:hypothetical protein